MPSQSLVASYMYVSASNIQNQIHPPPPQHIFLDGHETIVFLNNPLVGIPSVFIIVRK